MTRSNEQANTPTEKERKKGGEGAHTRAENERRELRRKEERGDGVEPAAAAAGGGGGGGGFTKSAGHTGNRTRDLSHPKRESYH